jgi:hypothetical protein
MVRLEGLGQLRHLMILGLEPTPFLLVALSLEQLRSRVPPGNLLIRLSVNWTQWCHSMKVA